MLRTLTCLPGDSRGQIHQRGRPAHGRYGARAAIPICTRSSSGRASGRPGSARGRYRDDACVASGARSSSAPAGAVDLIALAADAGQGSCLCRRGLAMPQRAVGRTFALVVTEARAIDLVNIATYAEPGVVLVPKWPSCASSSGRPFYRPVIEASAVDLVTLVPAYPAAPS